MAAISTVIGAGGLYCIQEKINCFKEYISSWDHWSQIIIIAIILLFIFLVLVFFAKPIILTSIRWNTFNKMHTEELSNPQTKNNISTQNKMESLSKTIYSELDEIDKESKEDFGKIEKIIDYQEKRKRE